MFNIKNIKIPTRPGCYLYKDAQGKIIYVGKAINLKNRVRSYFSTKKHDSKTKLLVSKIRDVEFITTNSEVEALILEQSLIHKYQPKFNIDLKGSVRYAYIKITNELFPRIVTSRKIDEGGKFYGPYTDGTVRRQVISTLVRLFKIRTCVKLPKKVCLQYHIGNCLGPCEDKISSEEYLANVKNAERLLKGETKEIEKDLEVRMKFAAKEKKYELAKVFRDQLYSIKNIQERQSVDQAKDRDQDVINWLVKDGKIQIQVFNIIGGVIGSRHRFVLDYYEGVIEDFINHFYSIHLIPQEIILPSGVKSQEVVEEYLRRTKKEKFAFQYLPKIILTVAEKGQKKDLLDLVAQNLEISMGLEPGLSDLQKKLQLTKPPITIDFFDISNLKNKYIVGASIQLVNGSFNKSAYRKFKVKTTQTQDDFLSMQEVVFRRYNRLLEERGVLPDLVVIDGGRGQLNAALQSLARLELSLPICSLAKREEEIYLPGHPAPIRMNRSSPGIQMLIKGRDEVHRFVVTFNRKLRKIK